MSQPSLPPHPTPRESWRIEGRLYREQEPPPQPDEIQQTLADVLGFLTSPALAEDVALRQRLANRIGAILARMEEG